MGTLQLSSFNMKWIYVLICVGAIVLADNAIRSFGSGRAANAPVFSLDAREEALADVLERLANKSGYTIIFKGEGADLPVSIRLKDVTLEEMFRRILQRSNYTVVWNDPEKTVSLSIYASAKGRKARKSRRDAAEKDGEEETPTMIFSGHKTDGDDEGDRTNRERGHGLTITGEETRFVQATDTTD